MDKTPLSEQDICSQFITPALKKFKCDDVTQIRKEVSFTEGRITVRRKLVSRGKAKCADYNLFYKPNIPIALVEPKRHTFAVADGVHQALGNAEILNIPFVFSSYGRGFVFHTGTSAELETTLHLDEFLTPGELWGRYRVGAS